VASIIFSSPAASRLRRACTMKSCGPWLAILGVASFQFGAKNPAVKVLPVKLPALPRPVGIITLKGRMISPVADSCDLGEIFHNQRGAIVLRQKWSRGQVEARLANLLPCLIGMEACVGAACASKCVRTLPT
jgi:hypothetical protein